MMSVAGSGLSDSEMMVVRCAIKGAIKRAAKSEDYDDIYQSCWLALLSALPKFDPAKGSLSTFTYNIAKGAFLDRIEKFERRRRLLPRVSMEDHWEAPQRPADADLTEAETKLWDAIERIKPCYARALVDHYVGGITVGELAARYKITYRSAESYLLKAKKLIRAILGDPRLDHEEAGNGKRKSLGVETGSSHD